MRGGLVDPKSRTLMVSLHKIVIFQYLVESFPGELALVFMEIDERLKFLVGEGAFSTLLIFFGVETDGIGIF
jgi:hypothetical protein